MRKFGGLVLGYTEHSFCSISKMLLCSINIAVQVKIEFYPVTVRPIKIDPLRRRSEAPEVNMKEAEVAQEDFIRPPATRSAIHAILMYELSFIKIGKKNKLNCQTVLTKFCYILNFCGQK